MKILDTNRAKYTKKLGKFKVCELCNPINIKKQECKNLAGKYWIVFVNKYPYMDGNVMIIPKRHISDIESLASEEWAELKIMMAKTKKMLTKIFGTKDFNIGLNIGKNSGNSLDHMHWQVIPRTKGASNSANIFADLYVIRQSPWDLKKMIEKQK